MGISYRGFGPHKFVPMDFVGDIVGDVFGGITGASQAAEGAERASEAQIQANRESIDFLRQVYNQQLGNNAMGTIAGQLGTNALLALAGLPQITSDQTQAWANANALGGGGAGGANGTYQIPTVATGNALQQLSADPGYQFRLDEGQRALEGSAAARGGLLSGRSIKDTQNYAQGLASQEFGNQWNRLASLAGFGQAANASNNQAAGNLGAGTTSSLQNIGNARGSSYIAQGNVVGNTFGSAGNLLGSVLGGFL